MLCSAAASAGISTEAWLAGPDTVGEGLGILAGPPRHTFICSSSVTHTHSIFANTYTHSAPATQPPGQQPCTDHRWHSQSSTPLSRSALHASDAIPALQADPCNSVLCADSGAVGCLVKAPSPAVPQPAQEAEHRGRMGAGLRWSCPQPAARGACAQQRPQAVTTCCCISCTCVQH